MMRTAATYIICLTAMLVTDFAVGSILRGLGGAMTIQIAGEDLAAWLGLVVGLIVAFWIRDRVESVWPRASTSR